MTIQVFLIRLNQWRPGKEAVASKKAEEIINGDEASLLDCEFERDIKTNEIKDLAIMNFLVKAINIDGAYAIIDPEGLDSFSRELNCRLAPDQKSRVFTLGNE